MTVTIFGKEYTCTRAERSGSRAMPLATGRTSSPRLRASAISPSSPDRRGLVLSGDGGRHRGGRRPWRGATSSWTSESAPPAPAP